MLATEMTCVCLEILGIRGHHEGVRYHHPSLARKARLETQVRKRKGHAVELR